MDDIFTRAIALKQDLIDFVLDAEGELATSLESYSATQLAQVAQSPAQNLMPYEMVTESFLITGKVGNQTPIDLFLEHEPQLTESDRQLLKQWHRSFPGLFVVVQVLPGGLELMNWLTAKHYQVQIPEAQLTRLTSGEILLTYLTPVTDQEWICSKIVGLGKLGKPKLAVAIGNFKQCYGKYLYSDAPELLTEAWRSVEQYHQDFVDFFNTDELTLPGYQWAKQLTSFQEVLTQRRLEAAGIDSSKTLSQLAEEAGLPPDEVAKEILGTEQLTEQPPAKMVNPTVELPNSLKKAAHVTALTHPRWGQTFLSTYSELKATLESQQLEPTTQTLILQCLRDPQVNAHIWYRLAEQYPVSLEKALQFALERSDFNLKTDLDRLLQEFNQPLEPILPEIASVPLHLHNLFQEALLEVGKDKSRSKVKRKTAMGFQP
ncbi:MAG: hypothetical protein KME11_10845 [Timaviella obliquedivisa GSE-PSE-MK23-08B]|nr:hypothetical protein [Timaviella obliquedivisa GSE-PSE-MK23-08B]